MALQLEVQELVLESLHKEAEPLELQVSWAKGRV